MIHLYDRRSEQTQLGERIRFRLDGNQEAVSVEIFLERLIERKDLRIRGGTVQISNKDVVYKGFRHSELLKLARDAREDESDELHKELIELMGASEEKKAVLLAYCGIVTGIFDFTEIDIEEALDTLEPTFSDFTSFIRIHRGTLVSISEEDRSLDACWDRIGASPYLFLPHALLIHNEVLVEEAEGLLETSLAEPASGGGWRGFGARRVGRLSNLEKNFHLADQKLGRYLPNIFNYITEREIIAKGIEGRGLSDRLAATQSKLEELRHRNESNWNFRRENGQRFIGMLLALVSMFEIKGVLFGDGEWLAFTITAIALEGIIYWLWGLGLKRGESKG